MRTAGVREGRTGALTVVTGPMFAGKTSTLLKLIKDRAERGEVVQVYRPLMDTRKAGLLIESHDGEQWPAIRVESMRAIRTVAGDAVQYVVIDEINMLAEDAVEVCQALMASGKDVVVAGLDTNHKREPFAPIDQLSAIAHHVFQLQSVCAQCQGHARYSKRLIDSDDTIVVGGEDLYEPRCGECFDL